jgi:hypothetical protein
MIPRAIQGHGAQFKHPHRARQLQYFDEQGLDLGQEAFAKSRDRVVVGMLIVGDVAKRHGVVGCALNCTAGENLR